MLWACVECACRTLPRTMIGKERLAKLCLLTWVCGWIGGITVSVDAHGGRFTLNKRKLKSLVQGIEQIAFTAANSVFKSESSLPSHDNPIQCLLRCRADASCHAAGTTNGAK